MTVARTIFEFQNAEHGYVVAEEWPDQTVTISVKADQNSEQQQITLPRLAFIGLIESAKEWENSSPLESAPDFPAG